MNYLLAVVGTGSALLLYLAWHASRHPGRTLPTEARRQLRRELRRHARVVIGLPLEITAHLGGMTGLSVNLGAGGMLLRPDGRLHLGEPVQLRFTLPGGAAPVHIAGAVCRLQGEHVAVRFDAADRQRLVIEQWIEARTAAPAR